MPKKSSKVPVTSKGKGKCEQDKVDDCVAQQKFCNIETNQCVQPKGVAQKMKSDSNIKADPEKGVFGKQTALDTIRNYLKTRSKSEQRKLSEGLPQKQTGAKQADIDSDDDFGWTAEAQQAYKQAKEAKKAPAKRSKTVPEIKVELKLLGVSDEKMKGKVKADLVKLLEKTKAKKQKVEVEVESPESPEEELEESPEEELEESPEEELEESPEEESPEEELEESPEVESPESPEEESPEEELEESPEPQEINLQSLTVPQLKQKLGEYGITSGIAKTVKADLIKMLQKEMKKGDKKPSKSSKENLEKLTKAQLFAELKKYGVVPKAKSVKPDLIKMLQKEMKKSEKKPSKEINYNTMTVPQLKELLKKRGITEGLSKYNKDDLIKLAKSCVSEGCGDNESCNVKKGKCESLVPAKNLYVLLHNGKRYHGSKSTLEKLAKDLMFKGHKIVESEELSEQSELESEEAEQSEVEQESVESEVEEAEKEVVEAQEALAEAQETIQEAKQAVETAVTQEEVEQAEESVQEAIESLEEAQKELDEAEQSLEEAETKVESDTGKERLERARKTLLVEAKNVQAYNNLSVNELKEEIINRGLKPTGNKATLIGLLVANDLMREAQPEIAERAKQAREKAEERVKQEAERLEKLQQEKLQRIKEKAKQAREKVEKEPTIPELVSIIGAVSGEKELSKEEAQLLEKIAKCIGY